METSEVIEILFLLLALVLLLYLANFLAHIGTFDQLQVLRGPLQPILIAVSQQRTAKPGLSPAMQTIATLVRGHGVEEDSSILGEQAHEIQRGELVGVYYAPVHPFMKECAAIQGVVLDVGERRVTQHTRAQWIARLEKKDIDVSVQILSVPDSLQVASRFDGWLSEIVAHWRVYRKLVKKVRKIQHSSTAPVQILEAISIRKKRAVSVIPVGCEICLSAS